MCVGYKSITKVKSDGSVGIIPNDDPNSSIQSFTLFIGLLNHYLAQAVAHPASRRGESINKWNDQTIMIKDITDIQYLLLILFYTFAMRYVHASATRCVSRALRCVSCVRAKLFHCVLRIARLFVGSGET